MAGWLSTHVLDTALGKPAEGIKIALYRVSGNSHRKIAEAVTNVDGRTDAPILDEKAFKTGTYELILKAFKTGTYELIFFAGDYLRSTEQAAEEPLFLDQVPIRFGMSADDHYHVPLLLSAYGYSTYRGS